MGEIRKPFQGVSNIVRFNWHFYLLAFSFVIGIFLLRSMLGPTPYLLATIVAVLIICVTLISLLVSCYVYDFSDLYKLSWLNNLRRDVQRIVNINAGFDETSVLLKDKFEGKELIVLDFYNPATHTEVSIKRARKAYPPFPGTVHIATDHLPVQDDSVDQIFAILSAHEVRSDAERVLLFKELNRVLAPAGQIVVTEHLRDFANFLAYNIGFFHFHSKATWISTFKNAGLTIAGEIKTTPFITTFILEKNGIAA